MRTLMKLALSIAPFIGCQTGQGLDRATVQFWGDTYLPRHVVNKYLGKAPAKAFGGIEPLLRLAEWNVANLEGVLTHSTLARTIDKTHLLRMSPTLAQTLKMAGIHVLSLGNNHSADFGDAGIFDTMAALHQEKLQHFGGELNADNATKPLIIPTSAGPICLLSLTLTLPESLWATEHRGGAGHATFSEIRRLVTECATLYPFTFAVFHWGEENQKHPKEYQRKLARLCVDAGATAVLGHHPHVLQDIEIYRNRMIVYSLGNFVFGTQPFHTSPEGLAAQFRLANDQIGIELIPISVNNRVVKFRPQPVGKWADAPSSLQVKLEGCRRAENPARLVCSYKNATL